MQWDLDSFRLDGETHVYRKLPNVGWVPWVKLAPSPGLGLGVFALRHFRAGETVARYTGRILGRVTNAEATRRVDWLEGSGTSTMLFTAHLPSGAWYVDGSRSLQSDESQQAAFGMVVMSRHTYGWPGAFAHFINSFQNVAPTQNVYVDAAGWVKVEDGIFIQAGDELLQNYGPEYHQEMRNRGTCRLPFDCTL